REIPFGYDCHWVREIALDVVRGTTGLRLDANATATVAASLTASMESRVRIDDGRLRLELLSSSGKSASAGVKATAGVTTEVKAAGGPDPLLSALAGIHPIEWVRRMLAASGSSDWRDLADAAGIRTRQLDALYTIWQDLSARSEAAIWRALGDESDFAELRRVAVLVASGELPVTVSGSAAGEWLASLAAPTAATVARNLLVWLDDSLLVSTAQRLRQYAIDVLDPSKLTDWAVASLSEQTGRILDQSGAKDALARLATLRDKIYAGTSSALNRKLAAELAVQAEASSGERCVLDVSFPATSAGAATLRAILAGGLDAALAARPDAVIHKGWFEAFLARRRYLDLTLPFIGRKYYSRDLDSLASASVESDALGSLIVYRLNTKEKVLVSGISSSTLLLAAAVSGRDGDPHCDNLNLTFEHRFSTAPHPGDAAWNLVLDAYGVNPKQWPAAKGEAALTIAAPGGLVLAWTNTPHPSTPEFEAAMSRISVALQSLMRRWLPALYFADPRRYQDIGAAWPLLVYAASRPYRSRGRGDYTYDSMDSRSVAAAASSASAAISSLIADAYRKMTAAGISRRLRFYEPGRPTDLLADALRRPQFVSLLSADAFLVRDMIRIAETGRELRTLWSKDTRAVVRRLARDGAYFIRCFHGRLKRLYAGNEILGLGSLVLVEATAALAGPGARLNVKLEWTGEDGQRMYWTPE
ncbi:MAG TPA: hypothetical protein PLZ95_16890, partial [Bryobacteraceae bacterium]|nr:hypothetical protein [Bryobacteraceae bacterium]